MASLAGHHTLGKWNFSASIRCHSPYKKRMPVVDDLLEICMAAPEICIFCTFLSMSGHALQSDTVYRDRHHIWAIGAVRSV